MKKIVGVFLLGIICLNLYGQEKKKRYPIWYTPSKNTSIYGVTIGPFIKEASQQKVHGIYLELLGQGLGGLFIGGDPFENAKDTLYPNSNRINGLSFSLLGTMSSTTSMNGIAVNPISSFYNQVNGIQAAGFLNVARKTNGLSIVLVSNIHYRFNGVQIAFFNSGRKVKGVQLGGINGADELKGIQLGLVNLVKQSRVIQVGLWNVNERRKMPIINWNFKNKHASH